MSLKCTPSLSKSTQTRREKQANSSDMARKSGKSLRLDALFRLQQKHLSSMRPERTDFSPGKQKRGQTEV